MLIEYFLQQPITVLIFNSQKVDNPPLCRC